MSPVLYQSRGGVADGKYLPGQYSWPVAKQLVSALVTGVPPVSGTLKLYLEIGGTLTDLFIAIPSGGAAFNVASALSAMVAANQVVRWLAAFDGAPEDAATQVSLSLVFVPVGSLPSSGLTVRDGASGMVFYSYDPAPHRFNPVIPAGVTPGWSLSQSGDVSLSLAIGGIEALSVAGGVVMAEAFFALGGTADPSAVRAEFFAGARRIGVVAADGFRAANVSEDAPAPASALSAQYGKQFQFWSGGTLTALLDDTGLTATALEESAEP